MVLRTLSCNETSLSPSVKLNIKLVSYNYESNIISDRLRAVARNCFEEFRISGILDLWVFIDFVYALICFYKTGTSSFQKEKFNLEKPLKYMPVWRRRNDVRRGQLTRVNYQ